jgi:hypothetical protein
VRICNGVLLLNLGLCKNSYLIACRCAKPAFVLAAGKKIAKRQHKSKKISICGKVWLYCTDHEFLNAPLLAANFL